MSPVPDLEALLERATALALRGTGYVEPNPRVAAMVLRDGEIIAEGWHREYGGPHAEIVALEKAGEAARGADLLVTLEPCTTRGKTPPCVGAIVKAGIKRVWYAAEDPNPIHRGKAIAELEKEGISCQQVPGHATGDALLESFRAYLEGELPWTVLKWAMSADGKVATVTGDSRWITSEESRTEVHKERARADAVLVGRATVATDDPMLDVRHGVRGDRDQPTRVVLDSGLHIDPKARLVQTARDIPTFVIHAAGKESAERRAALEEHGVRVFSTPQGEDGRVDPVEALRILRREGLHRVLIEGGPTVHGAMLTRGLGAWARVYVAPLVVGGITAPGPVAGPGFPTLGDSVWLDDLKLRIVEDGGSDFAVEGRLRNFRESTLHDEA